MVITTHPNIDTGNCIVLYFPRLFIACSRLSAWWDKPEKVERRLVLVVSFSSKACSIFPSQRTESLEQAEAQSFHNFCTHVQRMKGTVPQGITNWFSLRKQNVQVQEIFEWKSQFCHCVFLPPDPGGGGTAIYGPYRYGFQAVYSSIGYINQSFWV